MADSNIVIGVDKAALDESVSEIYGGAAALGKAAQRLEDAIDQIKKLRVEAAGPGVSDALERLGHQAGRSAGEQLERLVATLDGVTGLLARIAEALDGECEDHTANPEGWPLDRIATALEALRERINFTARLRDRTGFTPEDLEALAREADLDHPGGESNLGIWLRKIAKDRSATENHRS